MVYDDLSKQGGSREMSLPLKRPPGREAYPGTSSLGIPALRGSAKLSDALVVGPDLTYQSWKPRLAILAYTPTNVISITDGQIFLESDFFRIRLY